MFRRQTADDWAEDEAETKGHADQPHFLGALVWRRDVRDVGLRDGDVGAADAGDDSREEQDRERGGTGKRRTVAEDRVADRRACRADEQHRTPTDAIRKTAPHRRKEEQGQCVKAGQQAG